jgi:hypothetical protein
MGGEEISIRVAGLLQQSVEPSMSVNRNVTVPAGSSGIWHRSSHRWS